MQTGFSLIELLVVLVILGLLAGLVGPRLFGKVDTSKVKTAETQVKMLKAGLQTYRLDVGSYPTTEQGLAALNARPSSGRGVNLWQGPYLDEEIPVDPWANPYQYQLKPSNTQEFSLFSYGADGKRGGEGLDADIGYLPN
jgi:general secretion pathway protein G